MFSTTRIIAAVAAAGLMTIAAPALAAPSADKQIKAKVIQKNGMTLYCVKDVTTGTRVPRRICMTPQEWSHAGGRVVDTGSLVTEDDTEIASSIQKRTSNRN